MKNIFLYSLNPKKYVLLIKEKFSKAMLYLALIAVILGAIQSFTVVTLVNTVEKELKNDLTNGTLNFEMKDGNLDFKSSPYKEEQGQILLLIDTTKSTADAESLRSTVVHKEVSTVLFKDGLMVRRGSSQSVYKFSDFGLDTADFDNNTIADIIGKYNFVKYLLVPIIIIFKFVQLLVYALMISFAGVLSKLFNRQNLKYKEVFKLSIFSLTLPILVGLIFPIGMYTILVGGVVAVLGINHCIAEQYRD